ncbi:GNAT family N-acetyltransferase [Paenibacillus sp. NPDC058177]|uniref:GNAT family N-acetyltransferase n=1 Tax=Paenibacillus sp. NPDC058177 TaxID=3346369 RepID=UPI0036DE6A8D
MAEPAAGENGENLSSQDPIRVERVGVDRTEDILRMLRAAAQWMVDNGIRQWSPDQFTAQEIEGYFDQREVYLALDGETPVGLFTLQFSDPQYWGNKNDDGFAYLHRLTVSGPYRGSGLGEQMILFAAKQALKLGRKGLRLDTVSHNVKLNRYYQSLGFRYQGTNDAGGGRLVNLYQYHENSEDPDDILLRYFSVADFPLLQSWSLSPDFLKQWAGPSLTYPLDDEQLQKYMENTNHPAQSSLLIYSAVHRGSGKVVGHVSLSQINREDSHARISRLVVDPQFRGRGIGSRMLQEALRIGFAGLGLHRLALSVFDFNTSARKSYEAAGFVHEGTQREAVLIGGRYVDCLDMSLLDREWQELPR